MTDPQADYGRANDASPERLRQRKIDSLRLAINYHKSCIEEDQKRLDELLKEEGNDQ